MPFRTASRAHHKRSRPIGLLFPTMLSHPLPANCPSCQSSATAGTARWQPEMTRQTTASGDASRPPASSSVAWTGGRAPPAPPAQCPLSSTDPQHSHLRQVLSPGQEGSRPWCKASPEKPRCQPACPPCWCASPNSLPRWVSCRPRCLLRGQCCPAGRAPRATASRARAPLGCLE
uniref:Putative secreted protein n=1 Tax=Ixodes ricinus TaxID=34613 RepID=A0A6B0UZL0_IXORI